LIQVVTVYVFLSCLVFFGLFLVVWGLRLRNQCLSVESNAPESLTDERFDGEAELVDLRMSSEDIAITGTGLLEMLAPQGHAEIGSRSPDETKFERSRWRQNQGVALASSTLGRSLLYLRNKTARVLAILNSMRGSETPSLGSGASAESLPTGGIGALSKIEDNNSFIARHGAGLSPQALRSFRTYITRRHSRFTNRY
jgi:hypothetical protein